MSSNNGTKLTLDKDKQIPKIGCQNGGGGLVTKWCLTLATPWTVACQAPLSMGILQARILERVARPSSRGIFPTQGSSLRLLPLQHCRRISCLLSHQRSFKVNTQVKLGS